MTKRATQRAADNSDFVIHSSLDEGLISTPEQVGELISYIDPYGRVAIDTEADSLHCYREKLCLLQVSLPEGDFLVDPLAENDLGALADTLARKEMIRQDRKSTRLNSSHMSISYAVFCLKK